MSHHLDSPLARQDPRLNITDLYVFDYDGGTVLAMDVRTSLAGDAHPDAFHPEARYEFKIHSEGSQSESVTYRFAFGPTQDDGQPFTLVRLEGPAAADDSEAGIVIARGTTGLAASIDEGGQVWAGSAVEPFYLDLKQLEVVDRVVQHGEDGDITHWVSGVAADTFAGSTVSSIVLAVPNGRGPLEPGRRVSVWSTTKLATDAGGWKQVGRTGMPMIWPLFRDANSDEASWSNETHPSDDARNYRAGQEAMVAAATRRLGTSDRPEAYAAAVVDRLVPDVLTYVVGTPAQFSFAVFNGRRLSDNAPEVMFSLATNSAVPSGLRFSDVHRSQEAFPFVVPVSG